jgi:hypothetical protein
MALFTLILSLFSFTGYAKTIKVYCKSEGAQTSTFKLAASLEISDTDNSVITNVLVSFREKERQIPEQIITTKGFYRGFTEDKGYSYLFPMQATSSILHFILRLNASVEETSEIETIDNKKYVSNCTTVE